MPAAALLALAAKPCQVSVQSQKMAAGGDFIHSTHSFCSFVSQTLLRRSVAILPNHKSPGCTRVTRAAAHQPDEPMTRQRAQDTQPISSP